MCERIREFVLYRVADWSLIGVGKAVCTSTLFQSMKLTEYNPALRSRRKSACAAL